MAADPIAAAEQLAGSTYAGAQERTAASKKALLDGLAAQGTYQNQIQGDMVKSAAPAPAPARPSDSPALTAMSQQGALQVQAANQASLAAAATLAAQQRAAQMAASQTYFDQVGAAIPIEQSRAQSDAAQIMNELIQEREARANALAMQQLQMEAQREQIAAAREARAAAARERSSSGNMFEARLDDEDMVFESVAGGVDPLVYDGALLIANGTASMADYAQRLRDAGYTTSQIQSAQSDINQVLGNYYKGLDSIGYYDKYGIQKPIALTAPTLNKLMPGGKKQKTPPKTPGFWK